MLISAFSTSQVIAEDFELARQTVTPYNFFDCYYENTEPKVFDFKGMLGLVVPVNYKGYTLQDNSTPTTNGWADAGRHCSGILSTNKQLEVINHIPNVSLSVYQNTTSSIGETQVIFTANASDYEDQNFTYEWRKNGVLLSNTSKSYQYRSPGGYNINVSVTVYDSGVRLYNKDEGYWYNAEYPTFVQSTQATKDVAVQRWAGCGRNCIIH